MPQENSSEYKIGQFFAIFSAVQIGFGEKMKLRTEGRGTEPGQGKAINSSPATLRWRSTNRRKSVAEKGATMLRWRGRGSSENGRGLNKRSLMRYYASSRIAIADVNWRSAFVLFLTCPRPFFALYSFRNVRKTFLNVGDREDGGLLVLRYLIVYAIRCFSDCDAIEAWKS